MNNQPVQAPTLCGVSCPYCRGNSFVIRGIKGSRSASIAMGAAFGAIGSLVANSKSKDDYALKPVEFKCNGCGKKFEHPALLAPPEELLETPCTVNFERLKSFVGMAVAQHVWLNGVKVGIVGNGKTLSFPVYTKHNTLFVTDHNGVAFKVDYKFEATSGGVVNVRFKRKFV